MKTEQDATGMFGNCHWLNMHLMLTRRAGGGSLGYFAHASAKFPKARLSQTSQNVRIGGFVPPFFFVHYPLTLANTRFVSRMRMPTRQQSTHPLPGTLRISCHGFWTL